MLQSIGERHSFQLYISLFMLQRYVMAITASESGKIDRCGGGYAEDAIGAYLNVGIPKKFFYIFHSF